MAGCWGLPGQGLAVGSAAAGFQVLCGRRTGSYAHGPHSADVSSAATLPASRLGTVPTPPTSPPRATSKDRRYRRIINDNNLPYGYKSLCMGTLGAFGTTL